MAILWSLSTQTNRKTKDLKELVFYHDRSSPLKRTYTNPRLPFFRIFLTSEKREIAVELV